MEANLIVIGGDAELARARALIDRLMTSDKPEDVARLAAQARLVAAYRDSSPPMRKRNGRRARRARPRSSAI